MNQDSWTLPPSLDDPNFTFGVATSSFQIEGAWDSDGKVPSIWDSFCAQPARILDGSDGKQACEHYLRWREDIDLIDGLGVDAYRLSLAWGRIVTDVEGRVNQAGLDFYRNLLTELKRRNIKTCVTLYHWDLPQYLQDQGGWLNRSTALAFKYYTQIVAKQLGDLIDVFTTFNEPWCSAFLGYWHGIHAPGEQNRASALLAAHHLLLAHGMAMSTLRDNAPHSQCGIVLNLSPFVPIGESDTQAAAFATAENVDWFVQPLLEGRFPKIICDYYRDYLPPIQTEDMVLISAPLDYLGINFYTPQRILTAEPESPEHPPYQTWQPTEDVPRTSMGWEIHSPSLTQLLVELHQRFQMPPILITENGMASFDIVENDQVSDPVRQRYFQTHLDAVAQAMHEGVNIEGYFAWSLLDNFEWAEGYTQRFGLVYVDYETQSRVPKNSAKWLSKILKQRINHRPTDNNNRLYE